MFKVGDKVRCVHTDDYYYLTLGEVYTVKDVSEYFVYVEGVAVGHFHYRFELVQEETPSVETKEKEMKQMTKVMFTYSGDSATVILDGEIHTITSSEGSYAALVDELKKEVHDLDVIRGLVDKKKAVEAFSKGSVEIKGSTVYFKGEVVNDSLTDKMVALMDDGWDISPWIAFFENLQENPSFNSRKCLFNFLEKFQAPFTEDGCFIAFKRVDQDFKDLRTHQMDNSVGAIVEMDRNAVDDNPNNTCSSGLHVAASSYLDSYANASYAKTIMVKVNPRDVVAVPHDYNFAKMRVCRYEVIADITVEQMATLEKQTVVSSSWAVLADEPEWEVGDYIVATHSRYDITEGESYRIVEVDEFDETVCVYDDADERQWLNFDGTVY